MPERNEFEDMELHDVLQGALDAGISFTVAPNENPHKHPWIVFEGFYKSGTVKLFGVGDAFKPDYFTAVDRYGTETKIETFNDLVELNFEWWLKCSSRADCWGSPDEHWIKALTAAGLIEAEQQTVYKPSRHI